MKMSIARRIGAAVTLVFATALCAADTEAPAGPDGCGQHRKYQPARL